MAARPVPGGGAAGAGHQPHRERVPPGDLATPATCGHQPGLLVAPQRLCVRRQLLLAQLFPSGLARLNLGARDLARDGGGCSGRLWALGDGTLLGMSARGTRSPWSKLAASSSALPVCLVFTRTGWCRLGRSLC